MTQQSLFSPGSGGLETLLTRRDDPDTSKRAARKIVKSLTARQKEAWALVARFGPGTCAEIAARAAAEYGADGTRIYHALARRLPEIQPWYVDVERKDGKDVTRNGARVWRLA